jgi:hypothetical protein
MRLLLVIFRKDARRLWPGVVLCAVLLAVLAGIDNARADYAASMEEGILNVLLPLAWCGLLAQLVHQESPAAANPFWATRPYPWPTLVGAKILFALLFVHAPLLLANASVIAAHGFPPWRHAPALLWLQLTVAVAVTLPSLALASLARAFSQVAAVALLLLGAVFGLRAYAMPFDYPWVTVDTDSLVAALAALTVACGWLFVWQYARRRTVIARALGLGALLVAAAMFLHLPRELTASLRASATSVPRLELRPAEDAMTNPGASFIRSLTGLSIPVRLAGVPGERLFTATLLSLEVSDGESFHWKASERESASPIPKPMRGGLWLGEYRSGALSLVMLRETFERLKNSRLSVRGKAAITEFARQRQIPIPTGAAPADVEGVGRCSSLLTENSLSPYGNEMLKVFCESPEPLPGRVDVLLWARGNARPWRQFLGDAVGASRLPRLTWLSPLHRRQTFFHVLPVEQAFPGSGYIVPRHVLPNSQLGFAPWRESRRMVVPFEFKNLSLNEGLIQE